MSAATQLLAVMLCATVLLALVAQSLAYAQTLITLHTFNGAGPQGLVQAPNGDLRGSLTGSNIFGSSVGGVFKIDPDNGVAATRLLDAIDATAPGTSLVLATDGNVYGTAGGGAYNGGIIFRLTPNGALTTLYSFCATDCLDGDQPANLFQGTDGNLYGITQGGGPNDHGTVFTVTLGGTLTTLYGFCAHANTPCPDGEVPEGLVQGSDGNLYGTTLFGGAHDKGTVFQLTPSQILKTLYDFCGETGCTDGSTPVTGLVQANDGNFYGTTKSGGTNNNGTIFRITSGGELTTLHSFDGADGANPSAPLIQATDGNFYGTTQTSTTGLNGSGTIFQMTPGGALTTLYVFCAQSGCTDGEIPQGPLVQYTDGSFYGATAEGGFSAKNCSQSPDYGCGTVFNLATGLAPFVGTVPVSGRSGVQVGILGTNLTGATSVSFNGAAAAFKVVSSSLIVTTVPAGATTGSVTVVTPSATLPSNVAFQVN